MSIVRTLAAAVGTLVLIACTGLVASRAAQAAGGRTALLVANAAYPDSDAVLPTPIADAKALADELKRDGFAVTVVENASREAMQGAIDKFTRAIEPDSIALVYFGGYGIQAGRKNYLVPVDARIWTEADVARDGIAVDGLLEEMGKRRAGIRVAILDASRRNPFERRFRSFSQGLAVPAAPPGSMILYATAAGGVVSDAAGPKSPFMTELLQQIGTDQTADAAFAATRDALTKRTRNAQVPALSVNLDETFSFDPSRPRVPVSKAARPDDQAAKEKEAKEREAREKEARDREARDREARDRETRDREARDRETRDREARDRETRDREARDRETRDKEARDRDAREQETRDREARDREARDRDRRDRESREAAEQVQREFDAARAKGTRAGYQDFLDRNPSGPLADKARTEMARLTDDRAAADAFAAAEAQGTAQAYRDFLDRYPTGPYADRARDAQDRLATRDRRQDEQGRQRLTELDERIRRNPRDEDAYYARGQFYAQRGDSAAAIADFDQAIRLNPNSPEAYNNRCWMRAMSDDLKRALADCNQALKLRPGFLDALDSRGLVNLKSGAFRAAIVDYSDALRLDPRHASAFYGRGLARKRLGEDAQGGRDVATALEINAQIGEEFASYGLR